MIGKRKRFNVISSLVQKPTRKSLRERENRIMEVCTVK